MCSSGTDGGTGHVEDLLDALCGLLLLPSLPDAALWRTGWLLRQLVPRRPLSGGASRLSGHQCTMLESALRLSRKFIVAEFNGAP